MKNPKMCRMRLVRQVNGQYQFVTYIGPRYSTPNGWCIQATRVVGPTGGMAA